MGNGSPHELGGSVCYSTSLPHISSPYWSYKVNGDINISWLLYIACSAALSSLNSGVHVVWEMIHCLKTQQYQLYSTLDKTRKTKKIVWKDITVLTHPCFYITVTLTQDDLSSTDYILKINDILVIWFSSQVCDLCAFSLSMYSFF